MIRSALAAATASLAAAGVESPRADAELLAAHVLGTNRARLLTARSFTAEQAAEFDVLLRRRADRIPLQYLIGAHFYGLNLAVGAGVFIPRPETELLVEWGLAQLPPGKPIVVDLCSGSGAIAAAIASERPDAAVYAVERSPAALEWLRRNVSGTGVRVIAGDVVEPALLAELAGQVDLVLCNPPYVPQATAVPAEVARHDPAEALFAGADGLALMPSVIDAAMRWLKPLGALGIEHDDSHGESVPSLMIAAGLADVADHDDLAGRPRFATARSAR